MKHSMDDDVLHILHSALMVPILADRDDFEPKYEYKLPCPSCGDETASGLFYRISIKRIGCQLEK